MGAVNVNNADYKLLTRLAFERGNSVAQFELARKYKEGIELQKNMPMARLLLLKAARNKHRKAIWIVAYSYQIGKWGFPVNKVKSSYWNRQLLMNWRKDIDRGKRDAQSLFGDIQKQQNILAFIN